MNAPAAPEPADQQAANSSSQSPNSQQPNSQRPDDGVTVSLRLGARVVAAALVITLLAWLGSGLTTLNHDEQAVVLRWGAVSEVRTTSGTLWAFPAPIGEVVRLPAKERQFELQVQHFSPRIGYVLTGARVLHLTGTLTWSVSDPLRYFETLNPPAGPATNLAANDAANDAGTNRRTRRTRPQPRRTDPVASLRRRRGAHRPRPRRRALARSKSNVSCRTTSSRRSTTTSATPTRSACRCTPSPSIAPLPKLAQDAYDRTVRVKSEADRDVAAAKQAASRTVATAQTEADALLADARARRQEMVTAAQAAVAPVVAANALALGADTAQDPTTLLERVYREYLDRILGAGATARRRSAARHAAVCPANAATDAESLTARSVAHITAQESSHGQYVRKTDQRSRLALAPGRRIGVGRVGWLGARAGDCAAHDQPGFERLGRAAGCHRCALVGLPVFVRAVLALTRDDLEGISDQLVAVALLAAWAAGNLTAAALVPLAMVLGHVVAERSVLGTREAIAALTSLTKTTAQRW